MTNGSPKEFSDVVEAGKVLLWLLCTFTSKNKNMGMLTNLLIFPLYLNTVESFQC